MPTNFTFNSQDLDALYLPLVTTKRADVGFLVETSPGVFTDVSNRYEPIVEDPRPDVNYQSSTIDLSKLFCPIDYRQVSYEYYTVSETVDKYNYGFNNNGQVWIRIVNANLNSPGPSHSYTITLYNGTTNTVLATQNISFTGNTSSWVSFIGQTTGGYQINEGINTITVKDNGPGGITDVKRQISVAYAGPPAVQSPTTTIVYTK